MKELTPELQKQQDAKSNQEQVAVRKSRTFMGKVRLHPGQKLYSATIDFVTRKVLIQEVELQEKKVFGANVAAKKQVDMKDNTIYIPAINLKTAEKKFRKHLKKLKQGK